MLIRQVIAKEKLHTLFKIYNHRERSDSGPGAELGEDRQFPSPSARGQRAYPDSDEEPCGIVNRKLNSAAVKPVMKVLYNKPELAPKQFLLLADKLINLKLVETVDDYGYLTDHHEEAQVQACLRLSYDQQACIEKATLTDVEKKGQLADVTLRNLVCDLKQVDVNYWPHIPQGKNIVRITFVLDAVTLIVCPNVYSKLPLTILPELTTPSEPNEVLKIVSANAVKVFDLDNGSIKTFPTDKLYAARGLLKQLFESKSNICDAVKLIDLNMNRSLGALLLENHDKQPNVAARAKERSCTEEADGKGSEVSTGAAKNDVLNRLEG
ncbi:hypothetical protein pipiens_017426 [Culex pipiens pipiens]|uniref:Uncharacterized protein n=1 Tax=Culex pipiens pipiens TaxID=38569 RepID=A0ABD1CGN0_CULPP